MSGESSLNKRIATVAGVLTFAVLVIDALNGFAGLEAVQPFATKHYVAVAISDQATRTAATERDIQDRLINLQLMSLEMSLQLIDGQLSVARGDMVELRSKLTGSPRDLVIEKRVQELDASIGNLHQRREQLNCYLDNLKGFKRDCR